MTTKPQRKRIADYLYGRVEDALVSPAGFYAGLVTGSISDDGTINGEISGGNYSRVYIENNKNTFDTSDENAQVVNKINIEFPESSTAWGDISAVFFANAATGGQAQYYIPLSPARRVQAFTTVYFRGSVEESTGDIKLSVSN